MNEAIGNEVIGKKLDELKMHKGNVLQQMTKWTAELNATNGAIQTLEDLLNPKKAEEPKNEEETPKEE